MPFDYESLRRIPMDPRMLERIQRSSEMVSEQGDLMAGWGGPSVYKILIQLPTNQRLCYAAILEGHTTEDQIGIVTGLSPEEVSGSLSSLQNRGLVSVETS